MVSGKSIRAGQAFVEIALRDKMSGQLRALRAKLKNVGASFQRVGASFVAVGAAITAPLLLTAKAFANVGDTLQKMSLRTGIAVESLSSLKFAAEQSGASLETLEKGIKTMQRSLLDADLGLSTANDALERLGVTSAELQRMAPEEQFKT